MKTVSAGTKMVDKLTEKCTEKVVDLKLGKITSAEYENKHKHSSCTLYIILILTHFTAIVRIGTYFTYFVW